MCVLYGVQECSRESEMFTKLFKRSTSELASSVAESEADKGNAFDDFMETDDDMANFDGFSDEQVIDTQATAVGAETTIQGDLDVKRQLNIYGVVEGQVRCDSEVFIGETGRVNGDILAMNIRVAGYLDGVLECGQLTILNSGKVAGEAATDSFKIEEGGQFEGNSRRRTTDNVTQLTRGAKRAQIVSST